MLKILIVIVSLSYFCQHVRGIEDLTLWPSINEEKKDLSNLNAKYM